MEMNDVQRTFQICSYLLSYPNEELHQSLGDVEKDIFELKLTDIRTQLLAYVQKIQRIPLSDLIHNYVYTFDFGRKTNLYITYMTSGEQRERGVDLLYLKNYYKLHGFSATDLELPDFLPLMLEFAARVDDEVRMPIFSKYFDNIKEISNRLETNNNLYRHLFIAIMTALKESGITKSTRRSDELCLSNSCG